MPKRLSQMIALAILLAAPLMVAIVSRVVPSGNPPAAAANTAMSLDAATHETPPNPPPPAPPEPQPAMLPPQASADAVVDAAPMLDPQGIPPEPASPPAGNGDGSTSEEGGSVIEEGSSAAAL